MAKNRASSNSTFQDFQESFSYCQKLICLNSQFQTISSRKMAITGQRLLTVKNATFDTSKIFIGPVHLLPKTDKWDYCQSRIIAFFFVSCFDIGEVPRSPGKWNWNWLYFLPFIFTFEQAVYVIQAHLYSYFKEIFFYSKKKVFMHFLTDFQQPSLLRHLPSYLSEGQWFQPTHGFYSFLFYFCIFCILNPKGGGGGGPK